MAHKNSGINIEVTAAGVTLFEAQQSSHQVSGIAVRNIGETESSVFVKVEGLHGDDEPGVKILPSDTAMLRFGRDDITEVTCTSDNRQTAYIDWWVYAKGL